MTTSGRIPWRPWSPRNTSNTYGESFSRFSSEFFAPHGSFSRWFLVGETPHISVQLTSCSTQFTLLIVFHTSCIYNVVESGGPSSKKRGYCDSVVRTGTPSISLVRTEYVLVPSVLLVYLSLTLRGLLRAVSHIQHSHSLTRATQILCDSLRSYILYIPLFLYMSHPLICIS
jgi:hypothetical protein